MKLSPRLQYISQQVPLHAHVIDVATDHGYVAIQLAKANPKRQVIASDIAPQPLAAGQKNAEKYQVMNIEFRLGSGLSVLNATDTIDTAIIAGMGGRLMTDLLEDGKDKAIHRFILQPNNEASVVRMWLMDNGYTLIADERVRERSCLYEILVAKRKDQMVNVYASDLETRAAELFFGPNIKRTNVSAYKEWLTNKREQLISQKQQMLKSENPQVQQDIIKYDKLIAYSATRLEELQREEE